VQFLDLTFACRYVSGRARVADDENLAVGWFDPSSLPDMNLNNRTRIERTLAGEEVTYFQP
jgi:hypothetical protein